VSTYHENRATEAESTQKQEPADKRAQHWFLRPFYGQEPHGINCPDQGVAKDKKGNKNGGIHDILHKTVEAMMKGQIHEIWRNYLNKSKGSDNTVYKDKHKQQEKRVS